MKKLVLLFAVVGALCASADCFGQNQQSPASYFDRFVSRSSTVSPYLGLVTSQQSQSSQQGYIPPAVYQNRVRPRLEQRKTDAQQRRQISQIQTQLNDVKQTFQQRQSNSFGATGHATRFMLYQQYYPGFVSARRR